MTAGEKTKKGLKFIHRGQKAIIRSSYSARSVLTLPRDRYERKKSAKAAKN